MGRISYSSYLYAAIVGSTLVFTVGRFWTVAPTEALPAGLIVGLVICVLKIPVAAFAERFVEQPGIAAGAWLLSRWTDSVMTVAGAVHA